MAPESESKRGGLPRLLYRASRLRCPACGRGRLFRHWLRMERQCAHCHIAFERGPGFFLGSIYFNYGLTSLIVAIVYPILLFNQVSSNNRLLAASLAFCLLFPLWFFRYARSLWLAFDQFVDPR